MLRFIKRLLGHDAGEANSSSANELTVKSSSRQRGLRVTDAYFENMARIQGAIANQAFDEAAKYVRESFRYIPDWVRENVHEYGSFDISTIPALQQGGTMLALVGDDESLDQMRGIVNSTSELESWRAAVDQHLSDRVLFETIMAVVVENPNCLQTDVKRLTGMADGHRIGTLISYLEKAKKLVRVKTSRTYRLLLPGSSDLPEPPPKRIITSHRAGRNSPPLREIDIASLDYVPLPRAPLHWEQAQVARERAATPEPSEPFEIHDADWRIIAVEKNRRPSVPTPCFARCTRQSPDSSWSTISERRTVSARLTRPLCATTGRASWRPRRGSATAFIVLASIRWATA